jgi:hypothetical protein
MHKLIAVEVLPTLASQIQEFASKQLPDGTMCARESASARPSRRPTAPQPDHQADRHNRLLPTYAELHAKARELLDRLDRLDLDALSEDAQAQLRRRREELEALLAATAPDTAPLLVEAHTRLNRSLAAAELAALRQRQ